MNQESLDRLKLNPGDRRRSRTALLLIVVGVLLVIAVALYFARPWAKDVDRTLIGTSTAARGDSSPAPGARSATNSPPAGRPASASAPAAAPNNSVLTVSGYIINRERIELSPRYLGVVKWIGVKKGDAVTNGQVVVLLDDAEYRARLREIEGRLANARTELERTRLDFERTSSLATASIESQQARDHARLNVASAESVIAEIEGQRQLMQTYLDWTVIRAPIDGVVLEKLVDPNELVTPQSFGGTRGPSTALIALADPKDLQVEIELNEADVSKVFLNQPCQVSPEAFPDKVYDGYVAEMAPEANRQKGTLQIKVQIKNPDHFLTPELSAKVEFLGAKQAE